MVIVCEQCETRFHIADGRIPDKGARVRCSRCHHRFHVVPLTGAAPPDAKPEDSAPPAAGADPDLDNPEFLFDDDDQSGTEGAGTASDLDAPPGDPEPQATPEPEQETDEDAVFGQPEPGAPGGHAPVGFETTKIDAPESTSEAHSEPPAEPLRELAIGEASADLHADDVGDSTDADEILGSPEALAPGEMLAGGPAEAPQPETPAAESPLAYADLDAGEDPLGSPDALDHADQGDAAEEIAPEATSAPGSESPGPKPARARAPTAPIELESRARAPGGFALRALAVAVGLALAAGAVRVVGVRVLVDGSGPEVVQAAGWQAADLQTFRVRDATGRPVLVVRGSLQRDGARHAPRVQAVLLDVGGNPIGRPADGLLVRLDDAELAPEPLSAHLRGTAAPRGTHPDARVSGFTVLIPDPPLAARRFRLELLPGGRPT